MRQYRCIMCDHRFEADDKEQVYKCPKCRERFVELVEGTQIRGKKWGAKSYSVR